MKDGDSGELTLATPLTRRELEVMGYLRDGLSNREIAGQMTLALTTVKWYTRQIYNKMGVDSRQEAVEKALHLAVLPLPEEEASSTHNLPVQPSSFVGRKREMGDVMRLLARARLVTLTGPGGTGKTRLALQVAHLTAYDYPDGVSFVSLASTSDPRLVADAVAKGLGVVEQPNRPLVASLQGSLRGKKMLLVMDNYEHVLDAASLVTELMLFAPGLKVLITSRELLRLDGEHEYLVPPLAVPDTETITGWTELSDYESVTLFVQRARAASSHFRLTEDNGLSVATICQRLDGLPLAIELAAARSKVFSPGQILERLESRLGLLKGGRRDLPQRQRTLRDTIDWSYNLLTGDEQRLFARLAAFSGGRTIDTVEAVCGPGLAIDVLDGLESLLNKSLLFQEEGPGGEPRFVMLETIHEYAHERLAESGEEKEIRRRHLDVYLAMAERMEPGYWRHNQLLLIQRTEAELGNLRLAFDWAMESGSIEAAARLVSAVDYYLNYGGRIVQGGKWINRVLERIDEVPRKHRTRLLLAAGRLLFVGGEPERAEQMLHQGLALAGELGDRQAEAWFLISARGPATGKEESARQLRNTERGLAIFQDLNDKPGMAYALNFLGEIARYQGDYAKAREMYEACLAMCRVTGEGIRQMYQLVNLAYIAYHEGDYTISLELAISGLRQCVELQLKRDMAEGLWVVAGPLAWLGQPEKAARLMGASTARLADMGLTTPLSDRNEQLQYGADLRSMLDEAAYRTLYAEGEGMTLDEAVAYALE